MTHHRKPGHHSSRPARHTDLAVVPGELVRQAQLSMTSAQHLDDAWRTAEVGLQLDRGAAGDTPAGPTLLDHHAVCVASAASTLGYLGSVLELDMDLLEQVAFDFSGADEQAASTLAAGAAALPGGAV